MNISFKQLKGFIAVARHENFTRAAEEVHLTQAGISALVRDLEAQLGFDLFLRTTRNVVLTDKGRDFLVTAQNVSSEMENAIGRLNRVDRNQRQQLTIGVTPLVASYVMPDVMLAFNALQFGTKLEVLEIDRSAMRDKVESETIDAAFGAFFEVGSGIRRKQIMTSSLSLATPGHDDRRASAVSWTNLPEGAYIGLPPDNPIQQKVLRKLHAHGVRLNWSATYSHIETVIGMVEKGLGYALLPGFSSIITKRKSVSLIPIDPVEHTDYYCITLAGKKTSRELLALQKLFSDVFRGHHA